MRKSVKFSSEVQGACGAHGRGEPRPARFAGGGHRIESIAAKIGCAAETLRCWVRRLADRHDRGLPFGVQANGVKFLGADQPARRP